VSPSTNIHSVTSDSTATPSGSFFCSHCFHGIRVGKNLEAITLIERAVRAGTGRLISATAGSETGSIAEFRRGREAAQSFADL
jgi:hypothetical protein